MDLELPRGKFHQWHRLALAWTAAEESGLPHLPPFIWLGDLVGHWTARWCSKEINWRRGRARDCLFSNDVTLDLLKQLVEPYFQANSDLLVGCFQSSYPALLVEFQLCGHSFLLCQVLCIVLKLKIKSWDFGHTQCLLSGWPEHCILLISSSLSLFLSHAHQLAL